MITIDGITWDKFKDIKAQLKDNQDIKISYLSGMLEIRFPIDEEREEIKTTFGYLLEAYMREKGIRFYGRGGFTLEAPGYASGTPDESYSIGKKKEIPDIVIEIILTSGTINRRELYKPMKVPEVWFWKAGNLQVYHWRQGDYEEVSRSIFFSDLDLSLLLPYIGYPDQYDAVQEFQSVIRGDCS